MQNDQEKIVTTPSENNDGSGFEIVKTEPMSEQDAIMKEASIGSKITDTHGYSGVIVSNGRIEGDRVVTPVSSIHEPSKGIKVEILDPENPEHAEKIVALDNSAAILDSSGTTTLRHPLDFGNMDYNPSATKVLNIQRIDQAEAILGSFTDGAKKTNYFGENESMTEFETPQKSEAEKGWADAKDYWKEKVAAAATPLDDSEYQARKQQIANANSNGVQQYTRARGNEALVVNKFVLDGVSYPGDVVIGWAERHTPIRWCKPEDVITDHLSFYLPCKPALKTANPIPGVVAIKRKDGKLILLCGNIDLRFPFKAHIFNENQLTKGKLLDSLQLAKVWDNGGAELQKAATDAASILNMKPNKS